jgi:hypothetical protein
MITTNQFVSLDFPKWSSRQGKGVFVNVRPSRSINKKLGRADQVAACRYRRADKFQPSLKKLVERESFYEENLIKMEAL